MLVLTRILYAALLAPGLTTATVPRAQQELERPAGCFDGARIRANTKCLRGCMDWLSTLHAGVSRTPTTAEVLSLAKADYGRPGTLKIVHISDTHGHHRALRVPDGDILVHSGDVQCNTVAELYDFNEWLGELPHEHKLLVPGNHDTVFDPERFPQHKPVDFRAILTNCAVLIDEACTLEGIKFYGYNYCKNLPLECHNAFGRTPDQLRQLAHKLAQQQDIDILVTHGPPRGKCDRMVLGLRQGDPYLTEAVRALKPRFHLFGHLHEGYGIASEGGTVFSNGSSVNMLHDVCLKMNTPWTFPFQPREGTQEQSSMQMAHDNSHHFPLSLDHRTDNMNQTTNRQLTQKFS